MADNPGIEQSKQECDFCSRPATDRLEDSTPICKGHRIMADANYEYNANRLAARRWFKENPKDA